MIKNYLRKRTPEDKDPTIYHGPSPWQENLAQFIENGELRLDNKNLEVFFQLEHQPRFI